MNRKQRRLHLQSVGPPFGAITECKLTQSAVIQPLKKEPRPIVKILDEINFRQEDNFDDHMVYYTESSIRPCYLKCNDCDLSKISWLSGKPVPSSLCENVIKTDDELTLYLRRKSIPNK